VRADHRRERAMRSSDITLERFRDLEGTAVHDMNGEKIGAVDEVLLRRGHRGTRVDLGRDRVPQDEQGGRPGRGHPVRG
jgi:hypothetical protein